VATKKSRYLRQKIYILALGITLLSLLISTNPALAATDEVRWSRVNIPIQGKAGNWVLADGSDIQHLTMAADGTLYACGKSLTYTLYKSTDEGYGWSHTGNVTDSIVDIAAAPDDASAIYYATSSNVYRSTDGGKTFSLLPSNPGGAGSNNIEITSVAVNRLNSNNIISVGTRDTDNSQFGGVYTLDEEPVIPSWTNTNLTGYDVYAVAFSPNFTADRQLAAVVTNETDTFVTTKFGSAGWGATIGNTSLDKDNSGTPTPVVVANSAAIVFPDDYDAIYAEYVLFIAIDTGTGDGDVYKIDSVGTPGSAAATDLNIGAAYGLSNVDTTGLSVTGDATAAKMLAGTASSTQTYFSADGGSNWTRSRKQPTGGSKTYVLMAPDFSTSGRVYAATSGNESAFSVSQDSGTIWNQTSLIDTDIGTIVDLAPSPNYSQDNTLFMLTFGAKHSLWRSQDSGTTWERTFASNLPNVDSIDFVKPSPQYGNGSQVVFIAGSSNGTPAIWKSTDNGQTFTYRITSDPTTGTSPAIHTWAIINDTTLFIGSHDGSNGRVYRTTNSGISYSVGAAVGSQVLHSLALSPSYEEDETILAGNINGWVYWSNDNGTSFAPLPPDATSAPLTDNITVTFDPEFSRNNTVYAASSTADKGIYRFIIGTSTDWERIDSTLPGGGTLNQLAVSADGTLYAVNSKAGGGMERSLDPTYSLGPVFETVTRGLSDTATLSGLWLHDHRLWSTDTTSAKLMTFTDSLTSPPALTSPPDTAAGIGTLINHSISNVSLDWETINGATSYQWQLDHDTDFSSVPSGFEDNTKASSVRLPSLEPATTYYWRVRANEPALSPWSAKWSFTTCLDTDNTALRLESPKAGASTVPIKPVFQWSAVPGAEAYELLVSDDINFTNPCIIKNGDYALPTTAWQCNTSLNYDTTYYWKVIAVSSDTLSAWSAVGAFTTKSPPETPTPPVPQQPALPPMPSLPLMPATPSALSPEPHPAPQPLPPPPPLPVQVPVTPGWMIYLIGALLLTIILLLIIMLVLVVRVRRL